MNGLLTCLVFQANLHAQCHPLPPGDRRHHVGLRRLKDQQNKKITKQQNHKITIFYILFYLGLKNQQCLRKTIKLMFNKNVLFSYLIKINCHKEYHSHF